MLITLVVAVFLMIVEMTVNERISLTYISGVGYNVQCTGINFSCNDNTGLRFFWPTRSSKSIGAAFYHKWDDYTLAFSW